MIAVWWSLAVIVALLVGVACGYLLALIRTPSVIARMGPEQVESLAKRTAARRKEAA